MALLRQTAPDEEGYYLVDQVSGPTLNEGERVLLTDGYAAPVTSAEGGSEGEILGYLFLRAAEGREIFSAAEEAVAAKAARLLWPVLKQVKEEPGLGREAA